MVDFPYVTVYKRVKDTKPVSTASLYAHHIPISQRFKDHGPGPAPRNLFMLHAMGAFFYEACNS